MEVIGRCGFDSKISKGNVWISNIRIGFSFGREHRNTEFVLEILLTVVARAAWDCGQNNG